MIGILVVAHQDLAPALRRAAEGILGPMEQVETVSLTYTEPTEDARRRIESAVASVGGEGGVLVLTDMFGGTPTNLSLPFLEPGRVEVLAGVNLPMLLKAHSLRAELALPDLAAFLRDYGTKNIVLASEIWHARPAAKGRG